MQYHLDITGVDFLVDLFCTPQTSNCESKKHWAPLWVVTYPHCHTARKKPQKLKPSASAVLLKAGDKILFTLLHRLHVEFTLILQVCPNINFTSKHASRNCEKARNWFLSVIAQYWKILQETSPKTVAQSHISLHYYFLKTDWHYFYRAWTEITQRPISKSP